MGKKQDLTQRKGVNMFDNKQKRIVWSLVIGFVLCSALALKVALTNGVQASTSKPTIASTNVSAAKQHGNPAQTSPALPPIPAPLIKSISGGKSLITIRNSRREPIQITAELEVADNTYGNGFLHFSNVSGKKIAAFKGEFLITTNTGDVLKDGWSYSFSGSFQPENKLWEVPVGGPIQPIVNAPRKITHVQVRVTGVAYHEKSYWGEDGLAIAQKTSLAAKNLGILAEKVREGCLNMSDEDIAKEFSRPVPQQILMAEWNNGRFDLSPEYYFLFSRFLLDENKALRPNSRQIIDKLIENCKKLSD